MVTSDPQAVAWSVALRSSGQVGVDVGRGRSLLYLVTSLWMLVIAVGLLVVGEVGARVVGALMLVFTLGLAVMSAQLVFRIGSWRSPQVLVDGEGITVRHGWLRAPWSEIYGATGYTANHNRLVALVLSDECYDTWRAQRPLPLRLVTRRRSRRARVLQLPPNLAVDHEAFAEWIHHEARDRLLREVVEARRGLDAAVGEVRREAERLAEDERHS